MKKTKLFTVTAAILLLCCKDNKKKSKTDERSYVVLVSIDGMRYDYVERYDLKNFKKIKKEGVSTKGFIPCFPSVTFPNHYSIVTGLYPVNHGILSNGFYDKESDSWYSMSKTAAEGKWYKGHPIWNWAKKYGYKTACYFWVGSEAEIGGQRPDYYFSYDGKVPYDKRVQQVIDWLSLPLEKRPHFVSVYFSSVDGAGHEHGTDSEVTQKTLMAMDSIIGNFRSRLDSLPLNIHLLIVSDHGMQTVDKENPVLLKKDTLKKIKGVKDAWVGLTSAGVYLDSLAWQSKVRKELEKIVSQDNRIDTLLAAEEWESYFGQKLNQKAKNWWGEFILLPKPPYVFSKSPKINFVGMHGYDPKYKSMWGVFYGVGPQLKKNYEIEAFKNIHLYPLITKLLDIPNPKNLDSDPKLLEKALIKNN